MQIAPCQPHRADPAVQTQTCKQQRANPAPQPPAPCKRAVGGQNPSAAVPACREQDGAGRTRGQSKTHGCSPPSFVLPGTGAQAWRGPWAPRLPLLPHRLPSPGRLSWERRAVGYPSPWVPLLACHQCFWVEGEPSPHPHRGSAGWAWGSLWGSIAAEMLRGCWCYPWLEVHCVPASPLPGPRALPWPWVGNRAERWVQAPGEQRGTAPAPAPPAHSHGEPALPVLPRPTRHCASSSFPSYLGGF